MPPINYEPLAKMEEIKVGGQTIDWSQPKLQIFMDLPLLDKVVVVLITAAAIGSVFFVGGFGVFLLVVIPSYFFGKRLNNQEALIWQSFAMANGWQILPAPEARAFVPPSLANAGHSQKNTDAVAGTIGSLPIKILNYQYTIGSGRDSQTFVSTVVIAQMDKVDLPSIYLQSKKSLAVDPPPGLKQKLKLEGNFNQFFNVFTESGDEVDELVILTPDVMQFLISDGQDYDVETYSLGVAIFSKGDLRRVGKLPPMVNFCFRLYEQVMQNLPMAKLATESEPAVQQPAPNTTAPA